MQHAHAALILLRCWNGISMDIMARRPAVRQNLCSYYGLGPH
jgi:hypothetical protein